MTYINGNCKITIDNDGTRIIECNDESLQLSQPLNIDIRISTSCVFGFDTSTSNAICDFCHESAVKQGRDGDLQELKRVLSVLNPGIELAIGVNQVHPQLLDFLEWCKAKQYIVNCTMNQGHVWRDEKFLKFCLEDKLINGLGISYRNNMKMPPKWLLEHPNVVCHVIIGIDDFNTVSSLPYNKILILGEKDFGFNRNKVNLDKHSVWMYNILSLVKKFKIVSFDNLALEQLDMKRFFNKDSWSQFYQGEHSFYINAVTKTFSRSSRSEKTVSWDIGLLNYWNTLSTNV